MLSRAFAFVLGLTLSAQMLFAGGDDDFSSSAPAPALKPARSEICALMEGIQDISFAFDYSCHDPQDYSPTQQSWTTENPPPFDTWQDLLAFVSTGRPQCCFSLNVELTGVSSLPPMNMTGVHRLCIHDCKPNFPDKGFSAPHINTCSIKSSTFMAYPNFLRRSPRLKCLRLIPGVLQVPADAPKDLVVQFEDSVPHPLLTIPLEFSARQTPILLDYAGHQQGFRHYHPKQTSLGLGYWNKTQNHHPWRIPKLAQKPLKITITKDTQQCDVTEAEAAPNGTLTLEDLPPEILQHMIEMFLPSLMDQCSLAHTSRGLRAQVQEVYQRYSWSLLPFEHGLKLRWKLPSLKEIYFFHHNKDCVSSKKIKPFFGYKRESYWKYGRRVFPVDFCRCNRKGEVVHEERLYLSVCSRNYGRKERPILEIILTLTGQKDPRQIMLDGLFSDMEHYFPEPPWFISLNLREFQFDDPVMLESLMDLHLRKKFAPQICDYISDTILDLSSIRDRYSSLYYSTIMTHIMEQAFGEMVRPEGVL